MALGFVLHCPRAPFPDAFHGRKLLYAFELQGFVHSGRSKDFCSPLTGLHFLFVCFPESVMVNIINRQDLGSLRHKSQGMSVMPFLDGVRWS